jgi:hypothetical protein
MAIELAPPALAGNAYFLIHPGEPDRLLLGLAGYAAVMVVAQLRLLALYRTLSFTPVFWSFTFPCATMATFALRWLALEHPAGGSVYAGILIAASTGLIGAITVRTILAAARGRSNSPNVVGRSAYAGVRSSRTCGEDTAEFAFRSMNGGPRNHTSLLAGPADRDTVELPSDR